MIFDYLKRLAV